MFVSGCKCGTHFCVETINNCLPWRMGIFVIDCHNKIQKSILILFFLFFEQQRQISSLAMNSKSNMVMTILLSSISSKPFSILVTFLRTVYVYILSVGIFVYSIFNTMYIYYVYIKHFCMCK